MEGRVGPLRAFEELAQDGVRRETVPDSSGGNAPQPLRFLGTLKNIYNTGPRIAPKNLVSSLGTPHFLPGRTAPRFLFFFEDLAQDGVRRDWLLMWFGGARRTLALLRNLSETQGTQWRQSRPDRSAVSAKAGDARSGDGFEYAIGSDAPNHIVGGVGENNVAGCIPGDSGDESERDILRGTPEGITPPA